MCNSFFTTQDIVFLFVSVLLFLGVSVLLLMYLDGYWTRERCKERRLRNTFQGLDEKFAERRRQLQR